MGLFLMPDGGTDMGNRKEIFIDSIWQKSYA